MMTSLARHVKKLQFSVPAHASTPDLHSYSLLQPVHLACQILRRAALWPVLDLEYQSLLGRMLQALHQHPCQVFPANLPRRRILILQMLLHLLGAPFDFCGITAPEAEVTPDELSTLQTEPQVTGQKDAHGLLEDVQQVQATLDAHKFRAAS